MKAASSTTSTRAMSVSSLMELLWDRSGGVEHLLDPHRPFGFVDEHETGRREAAAVDGQVDRVVSRTIELDDCTPREADCAANRKLDAAELRGDADPECADRLRGDQRLGIPAVFDVLLGNPLG